MTVELPESLHDVPFSPEQRARFDALVRELEAASGAADLHPIVAEAMLCAIDPEGDGRSWCRSPPPRLRRHVQARLAEAHKDGTLPDAVFGLARLAVFMDHDLNLAPELFGEVLALADEAVVHYDLLKTVNAADPAAGLREQTLRETTGQPKPGAPAKLGDKPPEGALRADQIGPGRRRV